MMRTRGAGGEEQEGGAVHRRRFCLSAAGFLAERLRAYCAYCS